MSVLEAEAKAAPASRRRVAWASAVGTSVEWYDYHVYSIASALVIGRIFFPETSAAAATMAAFATFAVGFVARPLGGVLAGHLGDRIGRKRVMVMALVCMGVATTLIGVLPGYARIGVWAPVLLVVLRLLQGLSAGGEWGGAALLAVEHAPAGRRGVYGNFVQLGTPAGMFLANTVILLATFSLSDEQFFAWGWRVPFLASSVMVVIGYVIRVRVEESPVFRQMLEDDDLERMPLLRLFRMAPGRLALAVLTFLGNNAVGYIFLAFMSSYGTTVLGLSRNTMLGVLLVGCVTWFVSMIGFAALSDRIGRRRTYMIGYALLILWAVPFFLLFDTTRLPLILVAVVVLTFGLAATYGPQSALFAELFPAPVRTSGVSLSYAIGACVGGGFAPLIATALLSSTGTVLAVSGFMIVLSLVSLGAVVALGRYRSSFPSADGTFGRL
jgi:metabolite-proton symporter